MSRERDHHRASDASGDEPRRGEPGKRTRTRDLPASSGPVQRRIDPAGATSDPATTARWMDEAVRPDLYASVPPVTASTPRATTGAVIQRKAIVNDKPVS